MRCQKPTILDLHRILIGYLPSSPYNITLGVVFVTLRMILQNWVHNLSSISEFSKPVTSDPYNSIGTTIPSKSCICKSTGSCNLRDYLSTENIAFLACSASLRLLLIKRPLEGKKRTQVHKTILNI